MTSVPTSIPKAMRAGFPEAGYLGAEAHSGFMVTPTGSLVVMGAREARRMLERERRKQAKKSAPKGAK